jgi:hypothetical protein
MRPNMPIVYPLSAWRATRISIAALSRYHRQVPDFEHQRHKPPQPLSRPRELVIACAPMRSNVNLSRIARAAGCMAVGRIICTGPAKLDRNIARDGADTVEIETHRTLPPVLDKLRADGYRLVGLEQATNSCAARRS